MQVESNAASTLVDCEQRSERGGVVSESDDGLYVESSAANALVGCVLRCRTSESKAGVQA